MQKFIEGNNPLIVSVNYVPSDIKVDFVFLTKSKRYTQLLNEMQESVNGETDIIATSNVTKTNGKFQYVLNYGSLIDPHTDIIDNSLVMLLKAMIELNVNTVYLAGFDGYSKRSDNYFDTKREYSFAKEKAKYLNEYVIGFLSSVKADIQVQFVTRSYYNVKNERIMFMRHKLIVFDVDGTLLDTSEGVLSSVKFAIKNMGYELPSDAVLKTFIGPPVQDSFSRVFGVMGDKKIGWQIFLESDIRMLIC